MEQMMNKQAFEQTNDVIIPYFKGMQLPDAFTSLFSFDIYEEIDASYGTTNVYHTMKQLPMKQIIVLGLGEETQITRRKYRKAIASLLRSYKKDVVVYLDEAMKSFAHYEQYIYDAVFASIYGLHTFQKLQAPKKEEQKVSFAIPCEVQSVAELASTHATCVNHARDLGNTPANYMRPQDLANYAQDLAKQLNVECTVLNKKELEEMQAGALLAVNRGSTHEAKMIVLRYQGDGDAPYTALVGKGLTFDAGGYNLKSAGGMSGMKFDMCGGANVLGAFESIVRSNAKANIFAIVPATENKIDSDAYTCDEVITSLSGKTIEITNTDAEGRLILCDAITYAQKLGATAIIDMATLTGACVNALGTSYTGTFTNDKAFLEKLHEAAKQVEEKVWQLPVDDEFVEQVKTSYVADMTNAVVGGKGGASLAAAFLQQFIEDGVSWIHLDIAGTSDLSSDRKEAQKGATGVMIETLTKLFS